MGDVDKEKDIDRKSYTWKDLHSDLHNWAIYDSKQHIIVFKELKMENGEDDLVFGELEKNISVHVIVKDKNNRKPMGHLNKSLNCYANSVLQCLKATESFSKYLSGDDYGKTCPEEGDLCVSCCLQRYLLEDLQSSTAFLPTMILNCLEDLGDDFKNNRLGSQFSADEFLCAILSKFPAEKHPKNIDIYEQLFSGTLLTEHVCECGFKKAGETRDFQMLEIPIKLEDQVGFKSLKECMDAFTMKKPLNSRCEGCSLHKKSEETRIVACPEILIICLGRPVGTGEGSTKLVHDVDCPMDFDFSPYVSANGGVEQKYDLYGVIHHRQYGPKGGHYWCFTKYNGEWYEINDERVTSITKEGVEKKTKKVISFSIKGKWENILNHMASVQLKTTSQDGRTLIPYFSGPHLMKEILAVKNNAV
ncbi:Ubiquitin carboxyl-terminal hydrolase 18 [Triticum urartu]|uniref:ubiquitinyl hydrolase 1 n=1 Tax=Triticum urartu TaxID=4572 RepID=M7ZHG0_TRIUA|nr:Ubiquitin carboxyl-terminal hydrolase 18 [Triticum urartu]